MPEFRHAGRRRFLKTAAVAAASLASPQSFAAQPAMPRRALGQTGLELSILSFGGGSQFLNNRDGQWERMMETAIESGVNYFDTSPDYQWNSPLSSEERFGEILPAYRDRIILGTKLHERNVDLAKSQFERSLNRMKTDHVDLLLVHAVDGGDSVSALANGIYKLAQQLKDEGAARFIGFSSMDSSFRAQQCIEQLDGMDVCLLALSPTGYGDYIDRALPAAVERGIGVIAMKIMRNVVGSADPAELLDYAWELPGTASALIGHHGAARLDENIAIAKTAQPQQSSIDDFERFSMRHEGLRRRLAHLAGPHALEWARPGYGECAGRA